MGTMWTSVIVIPLQQAIEWYMHTTAWKSPPSWVVTTGLSGGSDPGRSCPIGSPHWRFQPRIPDSNTWTPSPCWTPKDAGPGLRPCLLQGQRDGEPTAESEEVCRPVRDGIPGGVRPDCTPALHAETNRLQKVCLTDADVSGAPKNGLPKQEV